VTEYHVKNYKRLGRKRSCPDLMCYIDICHHLNKPNTTSCFWQSVMQIANNKSLQNPFSNFKEVIYIHVNTISVIRTLSCSKESNFWLDVQNIERR
jgi:hypothetical protein